MCHGPSVRVGVDVVGNIADTKKFDKNIQEANEVIDLAQALNCEYIRLHAYLADGMLESKEDCDKTVKAFIPEILQKAISSKYA